MKSFLSRSLRYGFTILTRFLTQLIGTALSSVLPKHQPLLVGGIQRVGAHEFIGWAGRRDRWLRRSLVDVFDGGTWLDRIEAKAFSGDVPRSRSNLGFPTFRFAIPAALQDGDEHLLSFKHAGTDTALAPDPIRYWYPADGVGSPKPFLEMSSDVERLAQESANCSAENLCWNFDRDGYLHLRGLICPDLCNRIIERTDPWFRIESADGRYSWFKCHDLWTEVPEVRELAGNPDILQLVSHLHGRQAFPFQTLNLKYGSQQRAHSDTIHFSCFPRRFMCGAWVALEDVTEKAGPLFLYPGSHKLVERDFYDVGVDKDVDPYGRYELYVEQRMEAARLEKMPLLIQKGDVVVWASNTVHGGSPIADFSATRWSQVSHYYFKDCVYYVPMHSHPREHEYFLKPVTDILTGQRVEHTFNGRPVRSDPTADGRSRLTLS